MIKHIVMWDVLGVTPEEKSRNVELVRERFIGLRGQIPGLASLDVGVDTSRVDYACDMLLDTTFESWSALADYATHPAHLRVRDELAGIRIARHQVDYEIRGADA